jgi:two-component system chemotaxis response regulator CheY
MIQILIVDDNDNNRLALQLLLEEFENVHIKEAQDGQEAVACFEEMSFDLVFMDIMMPIMDGIEATKIIKSTHPHAMIIALSALDDKDSKHRMLLAGAEDYLTKPIESELFTQRIRNYLTILEYRNKPTQNAQATNPFSKNTFHKKTLFKVEGEEALAEFWDEALNEGPLSGYSDVVRVTYGFGLWLLKTGFSFEIIIEENEGEHFLSLLGCGSIKRSILTRLLNRHLPQTLYLCDKDGLYFQLPKFVKSTSGSIAVDDETKSILSKSHEGGVDAREYVENTVIAIMPKIESLEALEEVLDEVIIAYEKDPQEANLENLIAQFENYHGVVELLAEFEHLSFAIKSLIAFLQSLANRQIPDDKRQHLATMLLNLLQDLTSWREQIFIKQEALNIHYLDASLLSSCMQIEAILDEKSIDEGDDLEFF